METPVFEILLVEDNPDDVELIQQAFLESAVPLHLNVVEDGYEAIEFLRREGDFRFAPRPHLIIMDLNLPRKDGRETLAHMKQAQNLKEIPVIILTTSDAQPDVLTCYRSHANCFIVKAADMNVFTTDMRTMLAFWFGVATLPPRD